LDMVRNDRVEGEGRGRGKSPLRSFEIDEASMQCEIIYIGGCARELRHPELFKGLSRERSNRR
jgi:hypothetical protein